MKIFPELTISPELLDRTILAKSEIGSYTVMVNSPEVAIPLREVYDRTGLALKVLNPNTGGSKVIAQANKEGPVWGRANLRHASIIQNLFAREALAPRVYGWALVNGLLAQVTDYLPETTAPNRAEHQIRCSKVKVLMERYSLIPVKAHTAGGARILDLGMRNWRSNKLVDFSHLVFEDYQGYLASLDVRARTRRGKVLPKAYQPVPGLNIVGTRDIQARIENLRLSEIDWKGKNVLDIGCNFGSFSRYATDAGARRVIGMDKNGELSFEINNALGYWNMDIVTTTFPTKKRLPRADIVFMMAFHNYVGGLEAALSWSAPVANNLMIVESHGGEDQAYCEAILRKYFKRIDYLGYVQDPQVRHQWHCWK